MKGFATFNYVHGLEISEQPIFTGFDPLPHLPQLEEYCATRRTLSNAPFQTSFGEVKLACVERATSLAPVWCGDRFIVMTSVLLAGLKDYDDDDAVLQLQGESTKVPDDFCDRVRQMPRPLLANYLYRADYKELIAPSIAVATIWFRHVGALTEPPRPPLGPPLPRSPMPRVQLVRVDGHGAIIRNTDWPLNIVSSGHFPEMTRAVEEIGNRMVANDTFTFSQRGQVIQNVDVEWAWMSPGAGLAHIGFGGSAERTAFFIAGDDTPDHTALDTFCAQHFPAVAEQLAGQVRQEPFPLMLLSDDDASFQSSDRLGERFSIECVACAFVFAMDHLSGPGGRPR
jgi:hypothetical protein